MYDEHWLDRLHATSDGMRVYLLVDGVFIPGLHRLFRKALSPAQVPSLLFDYLPGCTEETRDVSPFIFPYLPSYEHLPVLLSKCSGWPMISAIETNESQAALTERLAAWCVVEIDTQRFNFRFPDTRRLPAIFDVLTAQQRAEFAGPAQRWSYIDRNGSWGELKLAGSSSAITQRPELDDQQFANLVSASEIDEVISILQCRGQAGPKLHSQWHSILSIALRVADKGNLDMAAKLSWCQACLRDGLVHDEIHACAQFAQWRSGATSVEEHFRVA